MVGIRLMILSLKRFLRALLYIARQYAGCLMPDFLIVFGLKLQPEKPTGSSALRNALCKPIVLIFLFLCLNTILRAEGTKELAPNSTDVTMLYANEATYGSFAAYDGPHSGRLLIQISDPSNEQVYLGFSRQASTNNGSDGNLINTAYYFRIKDPNGNIVYGPQIINSTTANADTWALASAGPAPIVGTSGYNPFTFIPTGLSAGDYYIEFSGNATTPSTGVIAIKFWDITVATTGSTPQAINGRLWSEKWSLRTPSISQGSDPTYTYYDRPFNGHVYLYTFDGFVSKVDFNNSGFRGLSFNLAYNETGVTNTGDFEVDRRSVANTNNTLTRYKIFINDPDITAYPSGNIGELYSNPVLVDCNASDLCISYAVTETGYIFVLLDFDSTSGPGLYDPGTADVLLYERMTPYIGESPPYERCIPWDGKNGLNNTVSLSNQVPIYFTYAQGMVHFPVYDVEYNVNGFGVTPVRPTVPGFTQKVFYDDVNIPANPGNGAPKVRVNGCSPPCHNYTNFSYGDLNTINTWWYTNQDLILSYQLSGCDLNAFNDTATTTIATPVVINVLSNDFGNNISNASVSNTGLLQAASGQLSINPATGAITYTPVAGFVGIDSFAYKVCDVGGSPCDTAKVIVTVICGTSAGNVISGAVFSDNNGNQVPNNGEAGKQHVTVSLYQDNNLNGQVDGADALVSTQETGSDGAYSFSINPPFSGSYTYDDAPAGGVAINSTSPCSSPIIRTFTVTQNMTVTDINVGFNATHTWRGDLQVTLQSPQGTTVTIISSSANDQDDNYDLLLDSASGNAIDDNNVDDVATPYYDRTASPSNSLNAFNGQNAMGTWTLRICDTYPSQDNGTYNRSQLQISGSFTNAYVLQIDTTDLPCGATMTTDNVETAVFFAPDQLDCANNFGFMPNPTTAVATSNSPVCASKTILLNETGTGAVSWSWSGPASFTSSLHNPSIANASSLNAGTYTVTVTDSKGCTYTSSTVVTVNANPTASISGTNTICAGGSTTLTASGGGTYLWSTAATTAAVTVTPATTTTYTVTVTNANGCTATATRTVTVNSNPTAGISGTNTICAGGSTTLTASGGGTYLWNTGATTAPIIVSPASTTSYSVTVTNASGCTAISGPFSVIVNQPVNAGTAVANDSTCLEGSGLPNIDLFEKLTGENAGGVWSVIGGSPGPNFNASTGVLNPNGLPIDTYTFRYTITGIPPCPDDTEDWTITVYRCCPPQICLPVSTIRNN